MQKDLQVNIRLFCRYVISGFQTTLKDGHVVSSHKS